MRGECREPLRLGGRLRLGAPLGHAGLGRRAGDRRRPVAGQQLDGKPFASKSRDGFRRIVPQPIGEGEAHGPGAGAREPKLRPAVILRIGDAAEAGRAQTDVAPLQALSGMFDHALQRSGVGHRADQRLGQRMARIGGEGRRDPQRFLVAAALDQLRPAERQGAGLVEHDMVDLRQALERGRREQKNARPQQPRAGDDLDDRDGQRQRARAGDDQHGGGDQQGAIPREVAQQHPAEERQQRRHMHDRGVGARHPVGDRHEARTAAFGRFDQAHDLGQQRVFAGGGHADADRRACD